MRFSDGQWPARARWGRLTSRRGHRRGAWDAEHRTAAQRCQRYLHGELLCCVPHEADGAGPGAVVPLRAAAGARATAEGPLPPAASPPKTRAELVARLRHGGSVYSAAAASQMAVSDSKRAGVSEAVADRGAPRCPVGLIRQRSRGDSVDDLHGGGQRARSSRGAAGQRGGAARDAGVASARAGGDTPEVAPTQPHLVPPSAPASVGCSCTDVVSVSTTSGPARRRLRGKQAAQFARAYSSPTIAPQPARAADDLG